MAKGKLGKKEEKGGEGMAREKGDWIAGARVDLGDRLGGQLLDNQTNCLFVQVLVKAPVLN